MIPVEDSEAVLGWWCPYVMRDYEENEVIRIKRLFYTKKDLPRVVIFSFSIFCSISRKQFFFSIRFGKFEIHDLFIYQGDRS